MEKEIITVSNVRGYIKDEVAYLNAEDVARGLGWSQTQIKNGREYTSTRWETINRYLADFGFPNILGKDDYIPEQAFYLLAMKASNDTAKAFQMKVATDILPSIRKHGIYATEGTIDRILNDPDFGIGLLTKLKEERAARVEAEKKNAILMHVNKTYTATEIAKELGLKSAIALNKLLEEKKIQYKVNGTWVLYSDYSVCGYEEVKQEVLDNGKVVYHRRFTQMGRDFIINLLSRD